MELSIFLAQILGLAYLCVGFGMLFNQKHYQKMITNFDKDASLLYFGGALALVLGFTLITHHNIWDNSWRVVISLIGWIAFLKGVFFLVFPTSIKPVIKWWKKKEAISFGTVLCLGLGLFFSYFGFFA